MDKQSHSHGYIFHTHLKDLHQVRPTIQREEEFWDTIQSKNFLSHY